MSQMPTFDILPRKVEAKFYIILIILGLSSLSGFFILKDRFWDSILLASFYGLCIVLGVGYFITMHYASNAGWMIAIRRVAESVSACIWIPFTGFVLLLFGVHSIYPWMHSGMGHHEPASPNFHYWFNSTGFMMRLFIYFIIWIFLLNRINRNSLDQDKKNELILTEKNIKLSSAYLVFGTIGFVLMSIDWLMSLQINWLSTVFPLIPIAGSLKVSTAFLALIAIYLRYKGYDKIIHDDILKTLSNLLIAFTTIWVYLWVSQHLLIWYANIPEETSYYIFRHFGGWGSLSFLNVLLNWLVPFLALLPGRFRSNDKILMYVSLILLIGGWLDLYIIIMPSVTGDNPSFNLLEVSPVFAVVLAVFVFSLKRMKKYPLVPVNDPYLIESLPDMVEQKAG